MVSFIRRPNIGHMIDALVINVAVDGAMTDIWRYQKEKREEQLHKHKAYSLKISASCQVFCPPVEMAGSFIIAQVIYFLSEKEVSMKGKLYVVATPIGNLKDLTLRAIEILQESDLIVAESRLRAMKLLTHLGLKKPMVTINTYSEEKRAKGIIARMEKGDVCALISAAGTPCISDPGKIVVQKAYEAGIDVMAIPGPSAVVAALCISGVPSDKFLFYGFLPLKTGKRRTILRDVGGAPYPLVFLESPRRVRDLLQLISEELGGDRFVAVAKEMTKLHEEVIRGPVQELVGDFAADAKGEYTVVVAQADYRP